MLKTFSIGGIHPSDKKISKDCKIEVLPVPSKVYISVAQHLGAPATPVVKVGDKVKAGQVIAEPAGFISAYVHSSVSGTVKSVGPRQDLAGKNMIHIEIEVEGDEWAEGIDLTDTLVTEIPEDNAAILEKIKLNGVVGLGGATFPAHVKPYTLEKSKHFYQNDEKFYISAELQRNLRLRGMKKCYIIGLAVKIRVKVEWI